MPEAVHLTHPGGEALADIALRFALNDALCEADDSGLGHARFEYDPAGNLTYSRTPSGQDDYEQNSAANAMKARWAAQARGRHSGPRQPALAAAGGGGKGPTSRPIGKPGLMQMAKGVPRSSALGSGLSPEAKAAIEKLENIKKDPVGEINNEKNHNHYAAARKEAQGTPGIGTPGKKINPKTGRPYSHIGDLQEAYNGLDKVSKALKRELEDKNGTLTDEARKTLTARYQESQQMQNRLKGFLNSIGYGKFPPIHTF